MKIHSKKFLIFFQVSLRSHKCDGIKTPKNNTDSKKEEEFKTTNNSTSKRDSKSSTSNKNINKTKKSNQNSPINERENISVNSLISPSSSSKQQLMPNDNSFFTPTSVNLGVEPLQNQDDFKKVSQLKVFVFLFKVITYKICLKIYLHYFNF